jgi:hypothetical protein
MRRQHLGQRHWQWLVGLGHDRRNCKRFVGLVDHGGESPALPIKLTERLSRLR